MGAPQKFRQRYIAFQADENLEKEKLIDTFVNIGREKNLSPQPWLILYNSNSGEGLVKCGHLQMDELIEEMKKNKKINFEILGVSGTIKKARKKFLT